MPYRGGWRTHSSQFAGAAEQLKSGALLVNPYDIEQMADTIVKAFRMTPAERTARMKRMRRMVRKENVFWWVDSFLAAGSQLAKRSHVAGEIFRDGASAFQEFNVLAPNRLLQLQCRVVQLGAIKFLILR